ncbi:uncharacterized protein ATNIH1004_001592 [Aspergillus tanneri]|nr:uncharacterized protein ATNIH1004_001592 [Aspergillus tanneri]KAA8652687.1 hypothetical protein ATNIH1004_001592 [Aspergillus tanneri]
MTKFIFHTARKRRSTGLKRVPINQWFNNYSLEDPNTRTELQLDGLLESSEFLRTLIDEEAKLLSNDPAVGDGYSRVVIGGLSQECAASVFCLLGGLPFVREDGESKPLGGFIGMSGWSPFSRADCWLLKIDEGDQGESESEAEEDDKDPFAHGTDGDEILLHIQAVNHIGIFSICHPFSLTPMEHYEHWYKVPDEIDDAVWFLKEKTRVPVVDEVD